MLWLQDREVMDRELPLLFSRSKFPGQEVDISGNSGAMNGASGVAQDDVMLSSSTTIAIAGPTGTIMEQDPQQAGQMDKSSSEPQSEALTVTICTPSDTAPEGSISSGRIDSVKVIFYITHGLNNGPFFVKYCNINTILPDTIKRKWSSWFDTIDGFVAAGSTSKFGNLKVEVADKKRRAACCSRWWRWEGSDIVCINRWWWKIQIQTWRWWHGENRWDNCFSGKGWIKLKKPSLCFLDWSQEGVTGFVQMNYKEFPPQTAKSTQQQEED